MAIRRTFFCYQFFVVTWERKWRLCVHLDNEPGVVVEYTLIIEFTFLAIKSSCFKRDKMFRERERERER